MNLAARAGELVMAGFTGTTVPADFAEQIQRDGLSGVILFSRNLTDAAQIKALTDELQAQRACDLPLLISVDQEGGVVARLTGIAGTVLPGSMALGATGSPELAHAAAQATARELLALGINFNLAPVLDVNNNPSNPVIGVRSYGEDPQLVAALGTAAIRGYQETGVLACGKHFPGHGDTDVDSHLALPLVPHDPARLDAVELAPFRAAVAGGVAALMTAHVVFPAFEPEPNRPATLSRRVLTGLLREQLGFDGIIITDCMEMKAIADGVGTVQAAVEAVKAGADIVLISHTAELQRAAVQALRADIASGEIPAAQVEASLRRIERARQQVARVAQPSLSVLGCAEHEALAARIAAAAVTVVRDRDQLLPLSPAGLGVVVCRGTLLSLVEDEQVPEPALAAAVRALAPDAEVLVVDREPSPEQVEAAVALARRCQSMVVATYSAARFRGQAALVEAVAGVCARTVVLAQRNPYDLRALPDVGTCVVTYEDRPLVLEAAVRVLLGQQAATGKLPVTL